MKRKTTIPQILAANIKRRRAELGWTQFQLAEALDLSTTYIAELEIAKKSPSMDVVQKLSAVLNMRPYELFIENGVDNAPGDNRNTIRQYTKDATIVLNEIIGITLQELTKKYLNR